MKRIQKRFIGIIISMLIMIFVLPSQMVSANTTKQSTPDIDIQIIKNESKKGNDENDIYFIMYIKGYLKENFKYAILNKENASEMEIHYNDAEQDKDGNYVAKVSEADIANQYLYLKTIESNNEAETKIKKVDYGTAFSVKDMKYVENTTNRIKTQLKTDITAKDEEVDGLRTTITVGGLIIEGNEDSKYYYSTTKLPNKDYDRLKELADKINSDFENSEIDMYSKIEIANEFKKLYTELAEKQEWKDVNRDLTIVQPENAEKDEEYIVYLKEEDSNGKEISTDIKIMKSYRTDKEETIPGKTETKVVKETTKLPITGDSIILFVILGIIILVTIIVFVRMRKLQANGKEK